MKRNAFTLVELLVVVLIVGILAAIALPQYQKAIEHARFNQLLLAAKTEQLAQELYFDEHGEYATQITDLGSEVAALFSNQLSIEHKIVCDAGNSTSSWARHQKIPGVFLRINYNHQCAAQKNMSGTRDCFASNKRANALCAFFAQRPQQASATQCSNYCRYYNF